MEHIFFSLGISVGCTGRSTKVARTAADLDGREQILQKDLSEAVSYVRIRQRYWKNGWGEDHDRKKYLYLLLHAAGTRTVTAKGCITSWQL